MAFWLRCLRISAIASSSKRLAPHFVHRYRERFRMTVPSRSVQTPRTRFWASAPHSGQGSGSGNFATRLRTAFFRGDKDIEHLLPLKLENLAFRVDRDSLKGHADDNVQVLAAARLRIRGAQSLGDSRRVQDGLVDFLLLERIGLQFLFGLFRKEDLASHNQSLDGLQNVHIQWSLLSTPPPSSSPRSRDRV